MANADLRPQFQVALRSDPATVALQEFRARKRGRFEAFSEETVDMLNTDMMANGTVLVVPMAFGSVTLLLMGYAAAGGVLSVMGLAGLTGLVASLRYIPIRKQLKRLRKAAKPVEEQVSADLRIWLKENYGAEPYPYSWNGYAQVEAEIVAPMLEESASERRLRLRSDNGAVIDALLVEVEPDRYELHKAEIQDRGEDPRLETLAQLNSRPSGQLPVIDRLQINS